MPYNYLMWDSYKAITETALTKDWAEHYGTTESPIDYFNGLDMIAVIPGTDMAGAGVFYGYQRHQGTKCKQTIVDYSWRMVFAENEEEFHSLLAEMQEIAYGLGYEDVLKAESGKCSCKICKLFKEARPSKRLNTSESKTGLSPDRTALKYYTGDIAAKQKDEAE